MATSAVARATKRSSNRSWRQRSLCAEAAHKRSNRSKRSRRSSRYETGSRNGLNGLNNLNVLNEFNNLVFNPILLPSARHDIQVLFGRQGERRVFMFSCGVDGDARADVTARVVLRDRGRRLRGG